MTVVSIRDASPGDFECICQLNRAEVQHTSEMDRDQLIELHRLAAYHRVSCVDDRIVGFLLAMNNAAPYANVNFQWFSSRFSSFLYIDRIVVDAGSRGLRLGSLLYQDLFAFARKSAFESIACEFNIIPENEPSRLFHAKFGFKELGTQWLNNRSKLVSLQMAQSSSGICAVA